MGEIASDEAVDTIINLAGEPVFGMPWTKTQRRKLRSSRIGSTGELVRLIARLERKPESLISASAIGYYGTAEEKPRNEGSLPTDEFVSRLCQAWEAEAAKAKAYNVRVCHLRLGVVLGTTGGVLAQFALPISLFAGTILGSGRQWMPWLHIDDAVDLVRHAMTSPQVIGPLNAAAPEHATHRTVIKAIGEVLNRPVWLRVPDPVLRLGLVEMSTILMDGVRVVPDKAISNRLSLCASEAEKCALRLAPARPAG